MGLARHARCAPRLAQALSDESANRAGTRRPRPRRDPGTPRRERHRGARTAARTVKGVDDFVRFVHRDPEAEVLVVSNTWPERERPVYGIFVQRQVESLRRAGVRFDVLYPRGYAHATAYGVAAGGAPWLAIGRRGGHPPRPAPRA